MRVVLFFFFKQKTAYEMRISDWSSDVCSSDLAERRNDPPEEPEIRERHVAQEVEDRVAPAVIRNSRPEVERDLDDDVGDDQDRVDKRDRKSVVSGKSVSVRVDLGGRRIIQKKK